MTGYSKAVLDLAAANHRRILFDLSNVDMDYALTTHVIEESEKMITEQELRHVFDNQKIFEPVTVFFKDGIEMTWAEAFNDFVRLGFRESVVIDNQWFGQGSIVRKSALSKPAAVEPAVPETPPAVSQTPEVSPPELDTADLNEIADAPKPQATDTPPATPVSEAQGAPAISTVMHADFADVRFVGVTEIEIIPTNYSIAADMEEHGGSTLLQGGLEANTTAAGPAAATFTNLKLSKAGTYKIKVTVAGVSTTLTIRVLPRAVPMLDDRP